MTSRLVTHPQSAPGLARLTSEFHLHELSLHPLYLIDTITLISLMCMSVWVCVCECVSVSMCIYECEYVCMWVWECVHVRVSVSMCVQKSQKSQKKSKNQKSQKNQIIQKI
jgi:hypothetical protein